MSSPALSAPGIKSYKNGQLNYSQPPTPSPPPLTSVCGEIRRHPVLGLHRGVVLMYDLLVAFGFKLLLRDTGRLQRRTGGAGGGNRLIPDPRLLLNILRTGVFGREMEVLGCRCWNCCNCSNWAVPLVVDDDPVEESSSSWELSLEEEQLHKAIV